MAAAAFSSVGVGRRSPPQSVNMAAPELYTSVDVIGRGSFGLIRKVKRISDGKIFARKEICFDNLRESDKKQIVAEVNILRKLRHPHIVQYEERHIDVHKGTLYIVMEYCEGGDLGQVIRKQKRENTRLKEDVVWSYLAQMASALHACHTRQGFQDSDGASSSSLPTSSSLASLAAALGQPSSLTPPALTGSGTPASKPLPPILHRDLKPENVFLTNQYVKLGDFGLSKELQADFTKTYVGTPYYMSPELAQGQAYDAKSDIWALGCIIFELCALSPPFDAKTQGELTMKIRKGAVPRLPPGYSDILAQVINEMLSLRPTRRPSTHDLLSHPVIKTHIQLLEALEMQSKNVEREALLQHRESVLREREAHLTLMMQEQEAQLAHAHEQLEARAAAAASLDPQLVGVSAQALAELTDREAAVREREQMLREEEMKLQMKFQQVEREWQQSREAALQALKEKLEREQRKQARLSLRQQQTAEDGEEARDSGASSRRPKITRVASNENSKPSIATRLPRSATRRVSSTPADVASRVSSSTAAVPASHSLGARASASGSRSGTTEPSRPSSDEWLEEEDNSDQQEEVEEAVKLPPVQSTPHRRNTAPPATHRVQQPTQPASQWVQGADDSDTRMWSVDHGDYSRSPALKTENQSQTQSAPVYRAKSLSAAASGRNLAELVAKNSAAANASGSAVPVRPPLRQRRSSNDNTSAESSAMSCDTMEDPSLPSPYMKKVVRRAMMPKRPSEVNVSANENLVSANRRPAARSSAGKEEGQEQKSSESISALPHGQTASTTEALKSSARPFPRISLNAKAQLPPTSTLTLGAAAPGAPAGRITGRPRSSRLATSVAPLPIAPTRRRSAAPAGA